MRGRERQWERMRDGLRGGRVGVVEGSMMEGGHGGEVEWEWGVGSNDGRGGGVVKTWEMSCIHKHTVYGHADHTTPQESSATQAQVPRLWRRRPELWCQPTQCKHPTYQQATSLRTSLIQLMEPSTTICCPANCSLNTFLQPESESSWLVGIPWMLVDASTDL